MDILYKIEKLAQIAIREKVFPGVAIGWQIEGDKHQIYCGKQTYDQDAKKISDDTFFDLASLTKAFWGTCAMLLFSLGMKKITLDTPIYKIIRYFDRLKNRDEVGDPRKITIRHLLTYSVSWKFRERLENHPQGDRLSVLGETSLDAHPGKIVRYSNYANYLLVETLLKVLNRRSAPNLLGEYLLGPLDMQNTLYFPLAGGVPREDIAPTQNGLRGIVHDPLAFSFGDYAIGPSGLFSTLPDMLKFLSFLLNRGVNRKGKQLITPQYFDQMVRNNVNVPKHQFGLGWDMFDSKYLDNEDLMKLFKETIVQGGFTGSVIAAFIQINFGLVILSNSIYPNPPQIRKAKKSPIYYFRKEVIETFLSYYFL